MAIPVLELEARAQKLLEEIKQLEVEIAEDADFIRRSLNDTSLQEIASGGHVESIIVDFSVSTRAIEDGTEALQKLSDKYREIFEKIRNAELIGLRQKSRERKLTEGPQIGTMYKLGYADVKGDLDLYLTIDVTIIQFDQKTPGEYITIDTQSFFIDDDPTQLDVTSARFASNGHDYVIVPHIDGGQIILYNLPDVLGVQTDPMVREPALWTKQTIADERVVGGGGSITTVNAKAALTAYERTVVSGICNGVDLTFNGSDTIGTFENFGFAGNPCVGALDMHTDIIITPNVMNSPVPAGPPTPLNLLYMYLDNNGSPIYDYYYTQSLGSQLSYSGVYWFENHAITGDTVEFTLTPLGDGDFEYLVTFDDGVTPEVYSYKLSDPEDPCLPFTSGPGCPQGKINLGLATDLMNGLAVAYQMESSPTIFKSGYVLIPEAVDPESLEIPTWRSIITPVALRDGSERPGCTGGWLGDFTTVWTDWDYHIGWVGFGDNLKGTVTPFSGSSFVSGGGPGDSVSDTITANGSSYLIPNYADRPPQAPLFRVFPRLSEGSRDFKTTAAQEGSPLGGPYTNADLGTTDEDCGCIEVSPCGTQQTWQTTFPNIPVGVDDVWGEFDIQRDILGSVLVANMTFDSAARAAMSRVGDLRIVVRPTCIGPPVGGVLVNCPADMTPLMLRDDGVSVSTDRILDETGTPINDADVTLRPCRFFLESFRGLCSTGASGSENLELAWLLDPGELDFGEVRVNLTDTAPFDFGMATTFLDWTDS